MLFRTGGGGGGDGISALNHTNLLAFGMVIHHLSALRENGKAYVEFLRTKALSTGVYILPAGGVDAQTPHNEEEVYFVISGRARFSNGVRDEVVKTGDILFLSAKEPHRFHEISERLELLVFFAPPEGTPHERPD